MTQDVQLKLISGLPWQKQHSTRTILFCQPNGLKLKEETSEILHIWSTDLCGAGTCGHFGRQIRSNKSF
jgi:hypothetical protein